MTTFKIKTRKDADNAILKLIMHKDNSFIRTEDNELIRLLSCSISHDNTTMWCEIEVQTAQGVIVREDCTDEDFQNYLFKYKGTYIQL